jgi:hypothetical protein
MFAMRARYPPRLGARALRIAVKDEPTNQRIVEILKWAMLPVEQTSQ